MTKKERLEYLRWKCEMAGPPLTRRERDILDLLAKATTQTPVTRPGI
jgi:hypothetical protein